MDRHYPNIPVRPVTDVYFGTEVTDPYRYLEQRDSEETKTVTAMENAYTKAFFDAYPAYSLAAPRRKAPDRQRPHRGGRRQDRGLGEAARLGL